MSHSITRDDALAILRAHRAEMEARGIRHAAVFGSVARGEADAESDLDVLIDFSPDMQMSVYDYVGHKLFIEDFFARSVDVVADRFLRPDVRESVKEDAIYAF